MKLLKLIIKYFYNKLEIDSENEYKNLPNGWLDTKQYTPIKKNKLYEVENSLGERKFILFRDSKTWYEIITKDNIVKWLNN